MGIFTVPAYVITMSLVLAAGSKEQALIVMDNERECVKLEKIIENDFLMLREAEKNMDMAAIEPRITLDSVKCWVIEVPINANQAREQL